MDAVEAVSPARARGIARPRRLLLAGVLLSLALAPAVLAGEPALWFIDTQAQFDPQVLAQPRLPAARRPATPVQFKEIVPYIVEEMDRHGVSMTFIVPPPLPPGAPASYDFEEIVPAIGEHRRRFAFLAGGGSLNTMIIETPPDRVSDALRKRFRQRALDILAAGALGFGEVTASHLSVPHVGMYEGTDADHPLLLMLADLAAEHDVPIDFHFDVVPADMPLPAFLQESLNPNPPTLRENLRAFERLLAHNRRARIVWSHAGSDPARQRTIPLMRRLLRAHPNLYMSIRVMARAPLPTAPLAPNGRLKPPWLKLISDFGDRFMMQSDHFYQMPPPLKARGAPDALRLGRELLSQLPEDVARAVASGNARRIYRLRE